MTRGRSLTDDLKWALAVLAGVLLGVLVLDADAAFLVGAVIGVTVVLVVRGAMRRYRARRT
jgi:divalent metal cation (Fe/Co/Zn/Cd) transporter